MPQSALQGEQWSSLSPSAAARTDQGVRPRAVLLAVAALAWIAALLLAPAAFAQEATPIPPAPERTAVRGTVVNGTTGERAPAGLEVRLVRFVGHESQTDTTTTDDGGTFTFTDVPVAREQAMYAVVVQYQGVFYTAEVDPTSATHALPVRIYETTHDLSTVEFQTAALVLMKVDRERQRVSMLELVTLQNLGDRTFTPDTGTSGMPSLLRFPLPEGAENLDVQFSVPGGDVVQVDAGFGITAPVPHGNHEAIITYEAPYRKGALVLDRTMPQGVKRFRLLVPQSLGRVSTDSLTEIAPAQFQQETYSAFEAVDVAPGARLAARVVGLPAKPFGAAVRDAFGSWYAYAVIPVVVGLVLVLAVALVVIRRRHAAVRAVQPQDVPQADVPEDADAMVEAIAALDDAHEAGDVPADEYEHRRNALKARLLTLRAEHDLSEANRT